MKKISCAILFSLGLMSSNAFALQKWPVEDTAVFQAITGMVRSQENSAAQAMEMAKLQENNTTAANMSRSVINIMSRQAKVVRDSTPDLQKCIDETRRNAGNGIGKMRSQFNELAGNAHRNSLNAAGNHTSTSNRSSLKTCTAIDKENNIAGCSTATIDSTFAGKSEDISTLLFNINNNTGLTLSDDQIEIVKAYIDQIDDFLPLSNNAGKDNNEYTQKINLLKQDLSTAKTLLSFSAAERVGSPINPKSAEGLLWFNENSKEEYKNFFDQPLPSKPSFLDRMNFYTQQDAYGNRGVLESTTDELAQLQKQNKILATNNVLLFNMIEKQNMQLAGLGQMIAQLSRISYVLDDPSKVATAGR